MSVNTKIENAVKSIVPKVWPDVCPEANVPDKFIVYNLADAEPDEWADDEENAWVLHMQVHLYTKSNPLKDTQKMKTALKKAGFTLEGIESLYDHTFGHRHIVIECWILEDDV